MRNQSNSTILKTRLWKKSICMFLSIVMALGTFVTMTFSNLTLSDYIDFRNLIVAEAATDSSTPLFYRYGELIGIYTVNYQDNSKLQYKIGDDGTWTDYSVPFAIPAHETTKVYAKKGTNGKATYASLSNTDKALGVYEESNIDFEILYNNITFPYTRSYNSVDKEWFDSTQSKVVNVDNHIEVELPDGSLYPVIRESDDLYIDELNGFTLSVTSDNYIFDNGNYKYYFAINEAQDICYLTVIEDYSGNRLSFIRSDNAVSISDDTGRSFILSFKNDGLIITDANGNNLKYETENGKYIQVKDQADVIIGEYTYDDDVMIKSMDKSISYYDNGRLKKITYDNGSYINYLYDDENMTYSTVASNGEMTKTVYNNAFLPVEYIDEYGIKNEYTYNMHCKVIKQKVDDETFAFTYNSKGDILSSTSDNIESNTHYTYDSQGNIIREKIGENYTYYTYDDNKNILISAALKEDFDGNVPDSYKSSLNCFDTIYYTYDDKGRITEKDSNNGAIYKYEYNDIGNVLKESSIVTIDDTTKTDIITHTYDDMGNLLTTNCDIDNSSYIYDEAGRILLADENGEATRILYDGYGRTVQEIEPKHYNSEKDGLPNNNTYEDTNVGYIYTYSEDGNLENITNDKGIVTTYVYNEVGERIRESFDIYEFNYSEQGEILSIKVAGEIKISYTYDEKNRLLTEDYANGDSIRYEYNDTGELSARYRNNNEKPYVTYSYDSDGKLKQIINADNGLKTVYDENDKVTIYKLSDNSILYSSFETPDETYEDIESNTAINVTENHFGNNFRYSISNNYVEYITDSSNIKYKSLFDKDNIIISDNVEVDNNIIINSSYNYDDNNKLSKKSLLFGTNSIDIINERNITDKIISTSNYDNKSKYIYDEKNQLISVEGNKFFSDYKYDNRGNIKTKILNNNTDNYSYSDGLWKDLLVSVNGIELTYDNNGNVLTYGDKSFTWENGRQLHSIKDNADTYLYTYDDQGYRTSKTVNGKTTYYNTKYGMLLSQSFDNNNIYFQYDNLGKPFGFVYNDVQYFYITNQFGDIISIIDATGDKIADYEYDEWGQIISISTTDKESERIANINPLRYRGYYYDIETGYYYLQSRYYDPSICRFINADDIMMAKCHKSENIGLNLFAYCCNNPIENSDPSGYWKKDDHYSWTKSWIQSQKRGTIYDKIRSDADTIANQCRNLDIEYPSTAYALSGFTSAAKKSWQYFHFNGNSTGTDSRTKYSNDMMTNALSAYKVNKSKGLMYLGYGLHAIQDIEAHGQIGRGADVPAHGATADNPNYEWKDSSHTTLQKVSGTAQPRYSATYTSSLNYLKRFCNAI